MLEEGFPHKEIMDALGISRRSLYNHLDEDKKIYTKMTPELKEKLNDMVSHGCTDEEIMQKLGISRRSLYNHKKKE